MSGYVQYGPFVDGSSPGISSAFLNPIETFLLSINSAAYDSHISANGSGVLTLVGMILNGAAQWNPSASTLNGATSGTATLYQVSTGTVKLAVCYCSGFRNGGGSAQTLALPTAFSTSFLFWNGGTPLLQLLLSGVAKTVQMQTALASGGGSVTGVTTIAQNSQGHVDTGFDTISFTGSQSGTNTGLIVFLGL